MVHEIKICEVDRKIGLDAQVIEIIPNGNIRQYFHLELAQFPFSSKTLSRGRP